MTQHLSPLPLDYQDKHPGLCKLSRTSGEGRQAESLDLTRTADGVYIRGLAATNDGPLWDLRVIESPSIPVLSATAGPVMVDPALLGLLYTGPTDFRSDPFTGMKNNTTDFLLELNLLFHVRDIVGAREIRS